MKESPEGYLWRQMLCHASLFFHPEALSLLEKTRIVFTSRREAASVRGPSIVIPTDIPFNVQPQSPYLVQFNGTHLTLWNPVDAPPGEGWQGIPGDGRHPLWYRHESGTHLPAWNLFGNLMGLLTFQEERELPVRDRHERFTAGFSPRAEANLLEVPAFNDAVAALIGACIGISRNGTADFHLENVLRPPVVVLSHDCDILRGNDFWTQGIRAGRIVLKVIRGKMPRPVDLWWIPRNALRPRDFYFDNIPRIVSLEREFGYTSTFYLLNGKGGRFGARSGSALLPEVIRSIPPGWDMGMHYNYDTHLHALRFSSQLGELSSLLGYMPVAGRAHYLRFDPEKSLPFLSSQGIRVDESAGYGDLIGYRCGIGGCFQAYDQGAGKASGIWEIPMVVMDGVLSSQYGGEAGASLERLLRHLTRVGGALSVIFHPDAFYNPEFPEMLGLYEKMLVACRDLGCRSETACALQKSIPARLMGRDE
jgi:hypothetical protein